MLYTFLSVVSCRW